MTKAHINKWTLSALNIPFVEHFHHSKKSRGQSDTLFMRVEDEKGNVGWGETLVRPYLTGESVETLILSWQKAAPLLQKMEWCLDDGTSPEAQTQSLESQLDEVLLQVKGNSAAPLSSLNGLRCGLELALLDLLLKRESRKLVDLFPPKINEVIYSGVISAEGAEKTFKIIKQLRQIGLQHFKLKVSTQTSFQFLGEVADALKGLSLRLDANGAFSLEEALHFCASLEGIPIDALEDPLVLPTPENLSTLQKQTTLPLMADEPLLSYGDAMDLIQHNAVRFLNVRLAKCGGILPSYKILNLAKARGLERTLGALVGESCLLSVAARTLACHLGHIRFLEGSFGTLLLKEDLGTRSARFGFGGKGPLISGPGLGISLREDVIRTYTVQRFEA